MIFSYHPNSGAGKLNIDGELFNHLIKTRRQKLSDKLLVSKLDGLKHYYQIQKISSKNAELALLSSEKINIKQPPYLHLGWSVVSSNVIKQTLPALNQLGLAKLTFIYADRSQKNTKINLGKLQKILINSCCQCGRYDLMQLDISPSIAVFLANNPQAVMLNLDQTLLKNYKNKINTIIVGAEGGFTADEVGLFSATKTLSLSSPYTLKSETAAITISSQLLNHLA